MEVKRNILIVSQAKVGPTETFIQAHIDRLDENIFHLYGYFLNYYENGTSLRDKYAHPEKRYHKLLHLLPYFLVFRIKQKAKNKQTDFELTKRYLIDNKIEVVLAEYGTTGAFITPVCKALKIPLIVHFHGNDASRYDLLKKFRMEYQSMFNYATYIIGVSKRMISDLQNLGCPEQKLIYNPYGPNPDFFKTEPDYSSNNIIANGRQTFKKAPYLTILAFQEVLKSNPDLKLHFVGDGEIMEVSQNMVKSLHLKDKIFFHGTQKCEEILKIITNSFLFVQHSMVAGDGDSEGTPVAILEAMAAGLPVIATKHAGIPDVVIDGETGYLVNEGDINLMANKIIELEKDRKLAKRMGEAGKKELQNILPCKSILKH